MKKIALVIISILVLGGLASGKETPKDGIIKEFYENGQLQDERNFKDGMQEGISKTYFESGQIDSEVMYKNNLKEGLGKFYYESGKLKSEANYKDGKLIDRKDYDEEGNFVSGDNKVE